VLESIWEKRSFRIGVRWLWIGAHDIELLSRPQLIRFVSPGQKNNMWDKDSDLQGFPAVSTGK
jgi:hypothetical protein